MLDRPLAALAVSARWHSRCGYLQMYASRLTRPKMVEVGGCERLRADNIRRKGHCVPPFGKPQAARNPPTYDDKGLRGDLLCQAMAWDRLELG